MLIEKEKLKIIMCSDLRIRFLCSVKLKKYNKRYV